MSRLRMSARAFIVWRWKESIPIGYGIAAECLRCRIEQDNSTGGILTSYRSSNNRIPNYSQSLVVHSRVSAQNVLWMVGDNDEITVQSISSLATNDKLPCNCNHGNQNILFDEKVTRVLPLTNAKYTELVPPYSRVASSNPS